MKQQINRELTFSFRSEQSDTRSMSTSLKLMSVLVANMSFINRRASAPKRPSLSQSYRSVPFTKKMFSATLSVSIVSPCSTASCCSLTTLRTALDCACVSFLHNSSHSVE